jgi:outer membrane receptor protein involved in Fe transport
VSTNFDLSLEWYYQRGGYVSVAAFQKTVDDYIVTLSADEGFPVNNASGNFPSGTATFRVSRPRNVETAR